MKTALITGAAKGIGRATALRLARAGFRIALHYHTSQAAARQTADDITRAGGHAQLFPADLTDPAQPEALVKTVDQTLGPLHTLVCNAGIIKSQLLPFTTLHDWRQVTAANLDAPFLLTKAAARLMARRKTGRIIYISSDAGLMGDLMRAAYSASKAALFGLAKTAARELAPSGVTVNTVSPGIITTDMTADIPDTRRARQLAAIPLARFGTPQEVANTVNYLASDAAAWITGQNLCVDGGLNTNT